MPLRLRLALLFAAGTTAVIAITGPAFVLQLRTSLDATLDTALNSRASALADQYTTTGPGGLRLGRDEEPAQLLTPAGVVIASSPDIAAHPVLDPAQRQAVANGTHLRFTTTVNAERTRVLATTVPGDPRLLIVVGVGTDISDAAVDHVQNGLLLGGVPAVAAAGVGAWLLAGAALRPVKRMRRQTARSARTTPPPTWPCQPPATRSPPWPPRSTTCSTGRTREALAAAVTAAGQETDRLIRLADDLLLLARAEAGQPFLRTQPVALHAFPSHPPTSRTALRPPQGIAAGDCRTGCAAAPHNVRGHRRLSPSQSHPATTGPNSNDASATPTTATSSFTPTHPRTSPPVGRNLSLPSIDFI